MRGGREGVCVVCMQTHEISNYVRGGGVLLWMVERNKQGDHRDKKV